MFPTTSLRQGIVQQQTPMRQQGFGGHFKDAPPTYIKETKEDNKIERKEKPKCPKGHKVCKCKKKKNKENKTSLR
tara:strand:- start:305 stop:529 length:225 start_codon:yes stop_codon:yes gene_type:complete